MASNGSESPDESFFNDLSQQAQDPNATNGQETQQDGSNKIKRIACVLCRKRKLRCDGTRPTCSTCKRLNHDCAYDEVRKKSGPKRGYVKLLEQRLRKLHILWLIVGTDSWAIEQVETLLKTQDTTDASKDAPRQDAASAYVANTISQALPNSGDGPNITGNTQATGRSGITGASPFQNVGTPGNDVGRETSWEMIGLGLEEPLPPQEIMDDLYEQNPVCGMMAALTLLQISNILLQDPSHIARHTQTTVHGRSESISSSAPAGVSAIHYVDPSGFHHGQVRGVTRTLLPTFQKVCADG